MRMTGEAFLAWPRKAITLLGMSGVGKTTLANKLPKSKWFHYSGDYRIGTKYLSEPILDNIKQQAMQVDFLRDLLRSDSIYIASNVTVHNLAPVASFLGKIGREDLGGLAVDEFKARQRLHEAAEVGAMCDVEPFIRKAREIYGYEHFINDAGGSICDPKPMYYQEAFLDEQLQEFLAETGLGSPADIVPDEFVRWIFPRHVAHRRPQYEAMADRYGYTVDARATERVTGESDFLELVAEAMG